MHGLLAQQVVINSATPSFSWFSVLGILILAITGIALLFTLILNEQTKRQWAHAERMQAMSLGLPLPANDSPWAKAVVSSAIGLGVPTVAFGFTMALLEERPETSAILWLAPSIVSGLSVLGSALLAASLFGRKGQSAAVSSVNPLAHGGYGSPHPKGMLDPDAYDVAGSRG